ncbi:MAG: DnaJ domain-containing protein [bacterium]|nr:DnaJ domain-containing protein [bacterium]
MRFLGPLLLAFGLMLGTAWAAGENLFVFSPGGKYVTKVTPAGRSSLISVRDAKDLREMAAWEITNFTVHSLEYDPKDPNRLLLAGPEKLLVYELHQGQPVKVLEKQADSGKKITHANFSPDHSEVYWSYQKSLHKADLSGQERQIAETNHSIKDLSALKDRRLAVVEEGQEGLLLYSEGTEAAPETLKGHQAPVVGAQSPEGKSLFSLDQNNQLFEWDLLNRKPQTGFALEPDNSGSQALALALDDQRKRLYVLKEKDGQQQIDSYALSDLKAQQILPRKEALVSTPSGRIYNGFEALTGESASAPPPLDPPEASDPKGPYRLALIEAEHGNLQAALHQIERVLPNDPDFAASRELQQEIYRRGEVRQDLLAAKEQYDMGNYRSAEILLESALAKDPGETEAQRYLELTQDKLWMGRFGNLVLVLAGLSLLGGLAWWLYQRRQETAKLFGGLFKDDGKERRRLILRLAKAREFLAIRRKQDRMGYYHGPLGAIERQLDQVEQQLKLPEAPYKDLLILVGQLHQEMAQMARSPHKSEPDPKEAEAQAQAAQEAQRQREQEARARNEEARRKREAQEKRAREQQAQEKRAHEQRSQQQQKKSQQQKTEQAQSPPPAQDPKGYFNVLGLKPGASEAEIKAAYRVKIKEYHPDKHSASGFEWVREEADRMTRLVQEAYQVLKDPKTRVRYERGRV